MRGCGCLTGPFPLLASPAKAAGGPWGRVVRRFLLIALVLALPVAATALIYAISVTLLQATNRTIEPQVLHYSAAAEYGVFLFLMILDVKNRW